MGVTTYYSVGGEIIGERSGGVRTDYLRDALGSVTATKRTDRGTISNTYRYKPYGERLAKTGVAADPRFQWVGTAGYRETAISHSKSYVRARHYGQEEGRWTTVDPLWPKEPVYLYAMSTPLTAIDSSGMACGMKQRDIVVKLSEWPRCKAKCEKIWTDPGSYLCGRCAYDLNTLMELTVNIRGCKNCVVYQWISKDGGPFRRDDALGWPYPWDICNGRGTPREYCKATDNPGESGNFVPCDQYFSVDREFITCVCCSGFSACYKWGAYHSADGCEKFCDYWGPVWMDKKSSIYNCVWASQ